MDQYKEEYIKVIKDNIRQYNTVIDIIDDNFYTSEIWGLYCYKYLDITVFPNDNVGIYKDSIQVFLSDSLDEINKFINYLLYDIKQALHYLCNKYNPGKKAYTVFIYADEDANELLYSYGFSDYNRAVKVADTYINDYRRIEIIDNVNEEKVY